LLSSDPFDVGSYLSEEIEPVYRIIVENGSLGLRCLFHNAVDQELNRIGNFPRPVFC